MRLSIGSGMARKWAVAIGISVLWSLAAWFGTDGMPIGDLAKYFSRDVPDPAWFATVVPRLTHLARMGLALLPWLLIGVTAATILFRRHFETLNQSKPFTWLVIAMALLSFPPPITASTTGLDQSWQWFLNHVAFTGAFGRDVVFTYGPLGFLLMPQLHLANALAALAANVFFLGTWCFCLLSLARLGEHERKSAWLLLATMFFPQGNMEWRWVALAALTVSVPLVRRLAKARPNVREDVLLTALGGMALALASLMKFSSLVTIAGTQVFVLFITMPLARGRARFVPMATWGIAFAAVFSCLAAFCFDSFSCFICWARGSLVIADGYNKYFISAKSAMHLLFMPTLLLAGCILLFLRAKANREKALFLLALSPLMFCTLKYGWTRQGPEAFCYVFCLVLSVATALSPHITSRIFCFISAIVLTSEALLIPRTTIGSRTCDFTFGINPSGLVKTLFLGPSLEQAQIETEKNAAEVQLPAEWHTRFKGKRVQFMPIDFAPAFGTTDFTMQTVPVLQLYSAYLPELDRVCAAAYDGANAPDYLVVTRDAYWNGNFIRHPQTWESVLCKYQFDAATSRHLLLARRARVIPPTTSPSRPLDVRCGEWIDSSQWQTMSIDWPQTLWGRFCTVFFRNTLTYLSLRYADGSIERIELNPATLKAPWPLDRIAITAEDVDKVLSGLPTRKPTAIRFEVTTPGLYRERIALNIRQ